MRKVPQRRTRPRRVIIRQVSLLQAPKPVTSEREAILLNMLRNQVLREDERRRSAEVLRQMEKAAAALMPKAPEATKSPAIAPEAIAQEPKAPEPKAPEPKAPEPKAEPPEKRKREGRPLSKRMAEFLESDEFRAFNLNDKQREELSQFEYRGAKGEPLKGGPNDTLKGLLREQIKKRGWGAGAQPLHERGQPPFTIIGPGRKLGK